MSNRFDFRAADQLSQACIITADKLDVCNGQMEKRFGELGDYFKDAGYDGYSLDMTAANRAIEDVIRQIQQVGLSISSYADQLKDAQ